MARIRTHNRRAKRPPYSVFARRRRHARKALRYAEMYGMGTAKLSEYARNLGFNGTVTGRLVSRGPEPQYQLPKVKAFNVDRVVHTNFAEQEARALIWHREELEKARERGDTVTEHTYADATIIPKEI